VRQTFYASLTLLFLSAVPVVHAQSGCTYATLNGNYAFTISGWATPPPKVLTEGKSSIPIAIVGVASFDGAGNWSTSFTYSHNGDISSGIAVPGTYTVNSNCTGTLTGAGEFSLVILNGGAETIGVQTDKDTTSTLIATKQDTSGCSNTTLTGSYAIRLTGSGTPPAKTVPANSSVPVALAGVATFDAGNFSGTFTRSHNGDISTSSDMGSYSVNSDCTGTITDQTEGTNFATVIFAGGTEAFGIETDNGTAVTFDLKKQ
jgi:hypothetical protein